MHEPASDAVAVLLPHPSIGEEERIRFDWPGARGETALRPRQPSIIRRHLCGESVFRRGENLSGSAGIREAFLPIAGLPANFRCIPGGRYPAYQDAAGGMKLTGAQRQACVRGHFGNDGNETAKRRFDPRRNRMAA